MYNDRLHLSDFVLRSLKEMTKDGTYDGTIEGVKVQNQKLTELARLQLLSSLKRYMSAMAP